VVVAAELGCLRLYGAILRRSFDDLFALINGGEVLEEEDGPLDESARIRLLQDTLAWFFDDQPSPCSLDVVCEVLGLTVERQRGRARKIIDGDAGNLRRKKLRPAQIEEIRIALNAGESTRQIAARFKIDMGTVRKHRIRFRRLAA